MSEIERFVTQGIRAARRVVVGVVGTTVIAVGVALLILPGPAFVVLPIGLGILAIEFEWARRLMRRARRLYETAARTSRPPESGRNSTIDPGRDSGDSDESRQTTTER
jgi:uncharacterized protein (TIGR02611 family)